MPRFAFITLLLSLVGCAGSQQDGKGRQRDSQGAPSQSAKAAKVTEEVAQKACQARMARALESPGLGVEQSLLERARLLGRARGEPLLFVSEPKSTAIEALPLEARRVQKRFAGSKIWPRLRGWRLHLRHEPKALRALVLKQGYVYAASPLEALALVTVFKLEDIFDAPTIWLHRGSRTHALIRKAGKRSYHHTEGSFAGRRASLLFGDRVAETRAELARPLHRELTELADRSGFDRLEPQHISEEHLVARLRFGSQWVRGLMKSDGAKLELECLDAPGAVARAVDTWRSTRRAEGRALRAVRDAITEQLNEGLPFDRPREEPTAERDGELRPAWRWAYAQGHSAFRVDEATYRVFDGRGRPHPPQVCADFVLESFERASGSWYLPQGEARERRVGGLDFDAYGIKNRRSVLALADFAEQTSVLFETLRVPKEERIRFGRRQEFFGYLLSHADQFRPGDIVAIRGRKNDGLIHQHALLIERVDPMTGFPYGLADQMKVPRRRTWEGIMAEAPLRSLYYRLRPTKFLFESIINQL